MEASPKILLTGKNGQVGFELVRALKPLGDVVATDAQQLDLTRVRELRRKVAEIKPSLIVNAAAYTAVDRAEQEPDRAREVNAVAPGVLAEQAEVLDIPLIHFSTDYVFNGEKKEPYDETDAPAPLCAYGRTKLEGERAVAGTGARYAVLRISWVYGRRGRNFLTALFAASEQQRAMRVVDDQVGAPTWSRMVAIATALVAARMMRSRDWESGIYHLPSGGETSWRGFAEAIFNLRRAREQGRSAEVVPVSSAEYGAPASRPAYSLMSGRKIFDRFGIRLPDWRIQLSDALED